MAQSPELGLTWPACLPAGDGRPQLLRVQAFNQLAEILSDRLVCREGQGAAAGEGEACLVHAGGGGGAISQGCACIWSSGCLACVSRVSLHVLRYY